MATNSFVINIEPTEVPNAVEQIGLTVECELNLDDPEDPRLVIRAPITFKLVEDGTVSITEQEPVGATISSGEISIVYTGGGGPA